MPFAVSPDTLCRPNVKSELPDRCVNRIAPNDSGRLTTEYECRHRHIAVELHTKREFGTGVVVSRSWSSESVTSGMFALARQNFIPAIDAKHG